MDINRIRQTRTDALSAKYIYTHKRAIINGWNITIEILAILIPILFLSALIIGKGTKAENILNIINIILSGILLSLSVLKYLLGFPSKLESYYERIAKNMNVAELAYNLMASPNNYNSSHESILYNQAYDVNVDDQRIIGTTGKKDKQKAYREALKELQPGVTTNNCSVCGASPWILKKGDSVCETCGNSK